MPKHKISPPQQVPQNRWETFVTSAFHHRMLIGVALIVITAFLAYLPSLSGGFILDDYLLLTNSYLIKASDGLYRFWCTTEANDYWPVSNTSLWFEWRLWGTNATGYRVTNLILHAAESLLIWIILRKLSLPGAFWAAIIFAVHPVNVESVAWIAQRKGLMAMFFFLLSILCYLKLEIPSPSSQNGIYRIASPLAPRLSPLWYWLSLAAFVLAMLSKGSVATLPVLLLGILWWLRPLTRWDLVRTAPFFVVALVLAGVNVWFQTHGSGEEIRTVSFVQRLLGAGSVVWFYLYKGLLPLNLVFVYPRWHIEASNLMWWLPLTAALIVTWILWQYRKGWSRPLLFAWGFFCVSLVPVLGFVDVGFMQYSLVADHYLHIALVGEIALLAAGWGVWHERVCGLSRWVLNTVTVGAVGALMLLTWQQSGLYNDAIILYQATLEKNPDCWMAHNNLGITLCYTSRLPEAIEHYQKAIQLKPDYPEAYNNLGNALLLIGRLPEATEYFQQALRLKPNYPEAHNNLGNALFQAGRPQEAIEYFQQSLQLNPDYAEAHNNLGNAFVQAGRLPEAIEHYQKALQLKPDYPEAYNNLGYALFQADRLPEAIEIFQQVLQSHRNFPEVHHNLGLALAKTGRPQEAIEHYQQALRLKPDYVEAYCNLALAYATTRQSKEALAAAQTALDLARSKGRTALAKEMEEWLNSYRASRSNRPDAAPASKGDSPTP